MSLFFFVINNGIISAEGMSGSDHRALNWSRIFIRKGHKVAVFIPESGKPRYEKFDCIVTSKVCFSSPLGLFAAYLWRAIKCIRILLKSIESAEGAGQAVVYSSSDLLADSLPAVWAKIKNPRVRWISGLHLIAPNPFKGFKKMSTRGIVFPGAANIYYFLSQRLILLFMKRLAHTIMVSNHLDREFLLKKGFSGESVIVTYGAVNWDEVNAAKEVYPGYAACYVGRFHKQKGFPDLVEAWKEVCEVFPNALLAVVGSDVNFGAVLELVNRKGLAHNVRFLGFLSGADKFSALKSSKVCVFPSTYESFGMVAAEAMACGLPVVAYDLPVYEKIYPAGMLKAKIGDVKGLSERIIDLLSNEQRRQEIAAQAYKLSQEFSWEKTAEDILSRLG